MNRRNQILVVVLALQLVLVLVISLVRAPAAATQAKPLFDGVKTADVQQLTVQDTSGSKIELAQKNGAWVLPASDDFPANATKVTTFLDKLLKAQNGTLVAKNSSSYERLQVADSTYTRRVEIKLSDGQNTHAAHRVLRRRKFGVRTRRRCRRSMVHRRSEQQRCQRVGSGLDHLDVIYVAS